MASKICLSQTTTTIKVNPTLTYQTIKGWGTSLCWFANVVGGFPQAKVDTICKLITDPNELNMNVFRFNIGGGENPTHTHMRKDANMPGYKASATVNYDWTKDANQRNVLLKLNSLRNDVINEAFSNSPPYWMTNSLCASGGVNGVENLKTNQYSAFADYLTEVVKYYKENLGITFKTLEPFNEPNNTWGAYQRQEGCHFLIPSEIALIPEVYQQLKDKNMLSYCGISAMDESNVNGCIKSINSYVAKGNIMSKLIQINTHTYYGTSHKAVYNAAIAQKKELWMSETSLFGMNVKSISDYLLLTQRIIKDLRDLKPVVWNDWQVVADNEPNSGLLDVNYTTKVIKKTKAYFLRMQNSRFIKQGYTIIGSDQINTVAALDPSKTELVVLLLNQQTASQNFVLDLTSFNKLGEPVIYRTSNSEDCKKIAGGNFQNKKISYSAPATSLTTFVIPLNSVVAGIQEDENEIAPSTCFPNPFNKEIQLKSEGDFEFTVFDVAGTVMEKGHGNTSIYVGSSLAVGIYLIKIQNKKGSVFKKVSKE